ncbi:hypothetical protein [Paenibacillus sp. WLX2291]|uniref:hypothetical protein n=1 Tax=Paenibacillus sp. WLX2291 TaxID=3296934 RepID=UPI003984150D
MKKKTLYFSCLMLVLTVFSIFNSSFASASDNNVSSNTYSSKVELQCSLPNSAKSITPQTTCTANGGFARLDYIAGGLRWEVHPRSILPYTFVGEIEIYDLRGGYVTSFPLSGLGTPGSSVSNTIGVGRLGQGHYDAVLTGQAISTLGETFYVVPNCNVAFRIN